MTLPIRRNALRLLAPYIVVLALACSFTAQATPSFDEVKAAYTPSDAWLLARDGRVLQQTRLDKKVRRLEWTRIEEVSPALLRALIYSEDKRFYEHSGVDWNAVAASSWRNLWNSKTRGASTLTMQLAGLLEDGPARSGRRGVLPDRPFVGSRSNCGRPAIA